jgi:hypothetical protein
MAIIARDTSRNNFYKDLAYSLDISKNEEFDRFYNDKFPDLKKIETVTDKETQLKGIDKILTFENGSIITIDEKIRRKDYGDIYIELFSNLERQKKGWAYTSQCDYIVYYIEPTQQVYLLPVFLLRKAIRKHRKQWERTCKTVLSKNSLYTSYGLAIPKEILLGAITAEMTDSY